MLQEVIDLQKQAVSSLIEKIYLKDEITFKSPTGSGKTYMMADFMNKILKENEEIVFLVSSLSKGDLANQNYDKFSEYQNHKYFEKINPFLIASETSGEDRLFIPTDYNIYILPRDLYKENSKLNKGVLKDFLHNLILKKPLGKEKKVYLIKDESHIATNKLDELSTFFSKVINITATPNKKRGQHPDVEVSEIDAVNAKLIKTVSYEDEKETLSVALDKFKEIKSSYVSTIGINPCMIIQISNKDKSEQNKELEGIFDTLKSKYSDLKWMLIVDSDKECDTNDVFKEKNLPVSKWKEYAKKNTATIDIIIFKMVITEGWDIPRACMLYQIRDSKSQQLDTQVIGRIRRNPRLTDFEKLSKEQQDLITKAYVWGLRDKDSNAINEVVLSGNNLNNEIQKEIKIKTTRLVKLRDSKKFNLNTFIETKKDKLVRTNIFDLHRKQMKLTNEIKEIYEDYIDDISKWFKFVENIEDISKESKNIICNYDENMEIVKDEYENEKEVSFPLISYYAEHGNFKNIGNWIWQRTDNNEKFSFDSESELEWAEILLGLVEQDSPSGAGRIVKSVPIIQIIEGVEEQTKKYLIGKNFLANSEIKYEYYLNGIHSSYPDFIMKDYLDRIHVFESKSLNISIGLNIDSEEYENKVVALKECYKYASKLTGYYFYIPIKKDDKWMIFQMFNGEEKELSKKDFIDFMKK